MAQGWRAARPTTGRRCCPSPTVVRASSTCLAGALGGTDGRHHGQRPPGPRGARRGARGRARRRAHGIRRVGPGGRAAPARRRRARPRPDEHVGGRPAARGRPRAGGAQDRRRARWQRHERRRGRACSRRWVPARRAGWPGADSPWPRRPTTRCPAWPRWSRGSPAPRSCSPATSRPRCWACKGASAVDAPQKGASPELAQALEGALGRFADVVGAVAAAHRPVDLLTGKPRRLDTRGRAPAPRVAWATPCCCSGARGSAVSARCCDAVGFGDGGCPQRPRGDRGGRFDWQSLRGQGRRRGGGRGTRRRRRPACVVAGQCLVGRRETMAPRARPAPTPSPAAATRSRRWCRPGRDARRPHRPGGAHLVAAR